ncbi:AraC family transcriptional regulator [Pseudoclavibacter sp. RFBB5]|uniref:helix-turn-helix domain-containing protein n=1 Tax=Pseudoclavibacter sp. RFBB5 TaxID=2080574 RepID=UPI000CE8A3B7|nr:helix-turn-helix domain-containing protein [Pseudoclavibacter sp. RFBB5]PPG32121.1 hypothetical protein C5B97_03390 [Pseudoclavibacter sp. RFBB5]
MQEHVSQGGSDFDLGVVEVESRASGELPKVVSLTVDEAGQRAVETVRSWGWHVQSSAEEFTVAGDVLKSDTFALSRYRHSAASFRYVVPRAFAGGAARLLLACLEGEVVVDIAGTTETLTPGSVLFVNPEDLISKRSEVPVSSLLVFFPRPQSFTENYVGTTSESDAYLQVLIDASASILGGGLRAEDAAFTRVGLGVEALIWALATQTELRTLAKSGNDLAHVYSEAVKYVSRFASDESTTVNSMATALGASRAHLYRAFAATGDTASAYLRRARVRLAQRLLAEGASAEAAARGSGFGTARRMRSALSAAQVVDVEVTIETSS